MLTDGVNSQCSTGCIAGFAQTSLVHGNDSELILRALSQLRGFYGSVDDWPAIDFSPGQLSGLTFLHHVAQDGGSTIVCWGFPAHCHGVLCDVCDDRRFTRSRNICKTKKIATNFYILVLPEYR